MIHTLYARAFARCIIFTIHTGRVSGDISGIKYDGLVTIGSLKTTKFGRFRRTSQHPLFESKMQHGVFMGTYINGEFVTKIKSWDANEEYDHS